MLPMKLKKITGLVPHDKKYQLNSNGTIKPFTIQNEENRQEKKLRITFV